MPAADSVVTTGSAEGVKLLIILLGFEDESGERQNRGGIKFLNVREARKMKGGLVYDSSGMPAGLYDLWGNAYTVVLDLDYDERLRFNMGSKVVELKGRRVAVFSPGADGKLGSEDDVRTW